MPTFFKSTTDTDSEIDSDIDSDNNDSHNDSDHNSDATESTENDADDAADATESTENDADDAAGKSKNKFQTPTKASIGEFTGNYVLFLCCVFNQFAVSITSIHLSHVL